MAKLVPLFFLTAAPGGKYNAGEIGGCPEKEAAALIKAGIARLHGEEAKPDPAPESKPEPEKPFKKRPRGLEHLNRSMSSPETKKG